MRFKNWLLEQSPTMPGLMSQGQNPSQDAKDLSTAVQSVTKMPDVAKLATNANPSNVKQTQQGAMGIAQQFLKTNPVAGKNPNITAPAIANGLIQQVAGQTVPQFGQQPNKTPNSIQ